MNIVNTENTENTDYDVIVFGVRLVDEQAGATRKVERVGAAGVV